MRHPRLSLPNVAQHVLLRSNNREKIFTSSHDYRVYLQFLEEAAKKFACDVNAFCLMPDHIHLMVTPREDGNVSKVVQVMGRRYTQYFNSRSNREGSLFSPRYKSAVVDPDYALDVVQYVETNPGRSGLVNRPQDYMWSSYRCHNHDSLSDCFVEPPESFLKLANCRASRFKAYEARCKKKIKIPLLQRIRSETARSRVIGGEGFIERVEKYCGVKLSSRK